MVNGLNALLKQSGDRYYLLHIWILHCLAVVRFKDTVNTWNALIPAAASGSCRIGILVANISLKTGEIGAFSFECPVFSCLKYNVQHKSHGAEHGFEPCPFLLEVASNLAY